VGDPLLGDGFIRNHYDASLAEKLDNMLYPLRSAGAISLPNTRFIVGPGIFDTTGGPGDGRDKNDIGFWTLRGQEFVGPGMNQTTIRLSLRSTAANAAYPVFGCRVAEGSGSGAGVVIRDMTIEANMGEQEYYRRSVWL
jgi:hypothetical protein